MRGELDGLSPPLPRPKLGLDCVGGSVATAIVKALQCVQDMCRAWSLLGLWARLMRSIDLHGVWVEQLPGTGEKCNETTRLMLHLRIATSSATHPFSLRAQSGRHAGDVRGDVEPGGVRPPVRPHLPRRAPARVLAVGQLRARKGWRQAQGAGHGRRLRADEAQAHNAAAVSDGGAIEVSSHHDVLTFCRM